MITTISIIPPEIIQYFNKKLLIVPIIDDCKVLWACYLYITDVLYRKWHNYPNKLAKCKKLEMQFLELYERAKKKEEETKRFEFRPMRLLYHIGMSHKRNQAIYSRLRYKRTKSFSM